MKGDGDLDHPLKKLLVFGRRGAPDVLEGFVSVEELGIVEQRDSVQILVALHSFILAQRAKRRSKLRLYGLKLRFRAKDVRIEASPAENHVVIAGRHEKQQRH